MIEAILQVGSWESTCSACGRGCDPREATHETCLGYAKDQPPGCGARYVAVTSMYLGHDAIEATKRLRPDLPYSEGPFV